MRRFCHTLLAATLGLPAVLAPGAALAGGQCCGGAVAGNAGPAYPHAVYQGHAAPQTYYVIPQTSYAPGYLYYAVPQTRPIPGPASYAPGYAANAGDAEAAKLRRLLPLLVKMLELGSQIQSELQQPPPPQPPAAPRRRQQFYRPYQVPRRVLLLPQQPAYYPPRQWQAVILR